MAFRGDSTGTYTFPTGSTGSTVDLGARNNYRYINATNVYNTGISSIATGIVTVYGPPNDNIYYYNNGTKTTLCILNAYGIANNVNISYGTTYYSSVAKNPTNMSQPYSKVAAITSYIDRWYFIPDKAIYWYGYKNYSYYTNPGSVSSYSTVTGTAGGAWNATFTEDTNQLVYYGLEYFSGIIITAIYITRKIFSYEYDNLNTLKILADFSSCYDTSHVTISSVNNARPDNGYQIPAAYIKKTINVSKGTGVQLITLSDLTSSLGDSYIALVPNINDSGYVYIKAMWFE